MEAAGDIFGGKDSKIVFLLSNDINPDFTTLATTYRGKFIFSSTDGSVERYNCLLQILFGWFVVSSFYS